MELQEFIEAFLPDYKRKKKNFRFKGVSFSDKYFPEALQNFADRICQKQRENCVDYYNNIGIDYKKHWTKDIEPTARQLLFLIINAKQPEIELLTHDE